MAPQQQSQSLFLKFPRELRDHIYTGALRDETFDLASRSDRRPGAALLLACRQTNAEASDIFSELSDFFITIPYSDWIEVTPRIRHELEPFSDSDFSVLEAAPASAPHSVVRLFKLSARVEAMVQRLVEVLRKRDEDPLLQKLRVIVSRTESWVEVW